MLVSLLAALLAVTAPAQVGPAVRIVSQHARWTGLGPPDALGDDREPWFLISGQLENAGHEPLAQVRLVYELLSDGVVVAHEWGYNRRAEALRDPAVEAGAAAAPSPPIAPLAPGERDDFRMLFLRTDTPHFDAWRVRVDAPAPAPPTAAAHTAAP